MRSYYDNCKIEGYPILAPDRDLACSETDLDSDGSGRDELGYMHRIVLRQRVGKWKIKYSHLTNEEYEYMDTLLKKPEFSFYLKYGKKEISVKAYCSSVDYFLYNSISGIYKNVSFSVVEC